ncbi:hypothetical protein H4Q26_005726 [Puccinia striiformis f. sp. tritici PST-130]|nr:hypothetical protein H4Q26_005726 [Puccinia striiformis f. sp. tritici PST-130]
MALEGRGGTRWQQVACRGLEDMCPCFEWIDAIFREKANVTPMFEFDHSMIDARVDVGDSDSSDEEIFFDGWEPTQANERKFDILDKQIATESRRWEEAEARAERERDREANRLASENALMDKRLNLEGARLKRQDDLEVARAAAAIAKEDSLRAQKKAMVDQMLQAGSSAPEIAALVQLVYGSG